MTPIKAIALDPGKATGIVVGSINKRDDFDIIHYYCVEYTAEDDKRKARLKNPQVWAKQLSEIFIRNMPIDIAIVEEFIIFNRPGLSNSFIHQKIWAIEVIGAIKLLCAQFDIKTIEFAPSVKTGVEIKSQHRMPPIDHIRDAYRLLAYYTIFKVPA